MKIANIIEEGKVGGPQVRMVRVAAALSGRADTTIIMPRENAGPFQALCEENNLAYIALPISRITKEWRVALRYVFLFPYEIFRIRRVLKKGGFDLVHVSGGSWQYKGVIAARLAGIPSVWHLNDTQMPRLFRALFKLFSPLASGFIFASHRSKAYYGQTLAHRPHAVVPSTVDTAFFNPEKTPPLSSDLKAQLANAPVIGTVANVNPIKGLETFIRAAAEIRKKEPMLKAVVVGPIHDSQKTYHRRLLELARNLGVEDSLIWAGAYKDVRPPIAQYDVYLCTSLAESSPVSVWEAMAMGCPVVSTDVGDVARHIHTGESGYIAPIEDHIAIAEYAERLLASPRQAQKFGHKARVEVHKKFSPKRISEKTLSFYRQVLQDHITLPSSSDHN
jgi:glycosyltransferase involved in cell wall biosynthesis